MGVGGRWALRPVGGRRNVFGGSLTPLENGRQGVPLTVQLFAAVPLFDSMRRRIPAGIACAFVSLLFASVSSPALAYTPKLTESGAPIRWERPVLEVAIDDDLIAQMPGIEDALIDATHAWAGIPNAPLLAYVPGVTQDRVVVIRRPDNWGHDPGRLAVTVATHTAEGSMIFADVRLNNAYEMTAGETPGFGRRFDIRTVLIHELGHVLGLGESDVAGAAMWPTIPPGQRREELSEDDRDGIAMHYADVQYPTDGSPIPFCSAGTAPVSGFAFLGGLSALMLLRRRRR